MDKGLNSRQMDLINSLRDEAFAVKDCFTRYSIQSIGFVVLAIALIVRFQLDSAYMTLTLLPVIVLLSAIGRMGTHKYAAASRLVGYELHLERTHRLSKETHYEWKKEWADLGWEEAMRAWRVVQATVYQRVYIGPRDYSDLKKTVPPHWYEAILPRQLYWRWKQDELQSEFLPKDSINEPLWFEPKSLFAAADAAYYPGGYLGTVMNVIHASMAICLIFLGWTPVNIYIQGGAPMPVAVGVTASAVVSIGVTVILAVHAKQLYERQKVIEDGLLSIHSSAILWHAVVVAHYRSVETLERKSDGILYYKGYTKALSLQATDLADNILEIHEWMKPNRGGLPSNNQV